MIYYCTQKDNSNICNRERKCTSEMKHRRKYLHEQRKCLSDTAREKERIVYETVNSNIKKEYHQLY